MKKHLIILIALICFTTYSHLTFAQSDYTVKGKIANWPTDTVYLLRQGSNPHTDYVLTKDGSFEFKGSVNEPTVAYLITKKRKGVGKVIYLEPGEIQISGDFNKFKELKILGSPTYNEYEIVKTFHDSTLAKVNENIALQTVAENQEELEKLYVSMDSITKLDTEFILDFVKKHPNSVVSLGEINLLNVTLENSVLRELFNGLSEKVRSSEQGKKLEANLEFMGSDKVVNEPSEENQINF